MKVSVKQLSKDIAQEMNWTIKESDKIIKDVFSWIKKQLLLGYSVKLKNIAVFSMKTRRSRTVLHPISKDAIVLKEQRLPSFKVARSLLLLMNKKGKRHD